MNEANVQKETQEMIRKCVKIPLEFTDGVSYFTFRDDLVGEEVKIRLHIESMGEVEDYPYFIEIEAFSHENLNRIVFKRYHKTYEDASEDMKKFNVEDKFMDDIVIKKVSGPFES